MKRPIIYLCLSMALGIMFAVYYNWLFTVFLLFAIIILMCFTRYTFNVKYFLVLFVLFIIGYLDVTRINLELYQIDKISASEETLTVIGKIEQVDINNDSKLIIKVKAIEHNGSKTNPKINIIAYTKEDIKADVGDLVKLDGYLVGMKRPTNPGGFDELSYYYSRKIYYKLYSDNAVIINHSFNFNSLISNLRNSVYEHINYLFPENEASIISTMLLGMKEELSQDTKKLYQMSGISHLLAISGLHVSILGLGLFNFLKKVSNKIKTSAGISIIVLILYCLLTGGSISTVRATIMLCLMLLSYFFTERYDVFAAIFSAAFIILLLNPYQLFDVGFLLSFSAVLGIVLITPILEERYNQFNKKILSLLFVTLSASLCTYPVIAYFFYQLSFYGVIVNLIVVPIMSGVIGFSILAITLSYAWIKLGTFTAGIVYFILKYIEMITKLVPGLPIHIIHIKKPTILCILIYYLILFSAAAKRIKYRSIIIISLIIVMLTLNGSLRINDNKVEVTFLDVGQGDSAVINYQNKVWLVDGGGNINSTSEHNQGYYVLLPYLYSNGITHIEGIWISHSDFDHIYGIIEVIREVSVKYIVMSAPYQTYKDELTQKLIEVANEKNIDIYYLAKGDRITYNELSMTCVYPEKKISYYPNNNARSLVMQLKLNEFDILFPGDIEADQEFNLINSTCEEKLSSEILKVPHHGSGTSSSDIFIDEVSPKVAIFSYGEHNKFGHPSISVVNKYETRGIDDYHIKDEGAVTVTSNGKSFSIFSCSTKRKADYLCSD